MRNVKKHNLNFRVRTLAKYGLTLESYDAMLAEQGGACKICGGKPSDRRLMVDHDHETGLVRGLLCNNCNRSAGLVHDRPELLRALADYIESARAMKAVS